MQGLVFGQPDRELGRRFRVLAQVTGLARRADVGGVVGATARDRNGVIQDFVGVAAIGTQTAVVSDPGQVVRSRAPEATAGEISESLVALGYLGQKALRVLLAPLVHITSVVSEPAFSVLTAPGLRELVRTGPARALQPVARRPVGAELSKWFGFATRPAPFQTPPLPPAKLVSWTGDTHHGPSTSKSDQAASIVGASRRNFRTSCSLRLIFRCTGSWTWP